MTLTTQQRDVLIQAIQETVTTQLIARGIHAPLTCVDTDFITFKSEPFQTTPVLFKELQVTVDQVHIIREEDPNPESRYLGSLDVKCDYTHFSGGHNHSSLMNISFYFDADELVESRSNPIFGVSIHV